MQTDRGRGPAGERPTAWRCAKPTPTSLPTTSAPTAAGSPTSVAPAPDAVAQLLKEQMLQTAAELLEVPAASLVVDHGRVYPAGDASRGLTYADIATTIKTKAGRDLIATYTHSAPTNPGAYSVQFAEVEVDCETGACSVTDFLAVGDVGQAINRGVVEGQFRGGVQMGIGYALCEEVILDQLRTGLPERLRGLPSGHDARHAGHARPADRARGGCRAVWREERRGDRHGPHGGGGRQRRQSCSRDVAHGHARDPREDTGRPGGKTSRSSTKPRHWPSRAGVGRAAPASDGEADSVLV